MEKHVQIRKTQNRHEIIQNLKKEWSEDKTDENVWDTLEEFLEK